MQNNSDIQETCSICFEKTTEKIACHHYFHSECIKNWTTNSCPVCRKAIDSSKPITKLKSSTLEEDAELAREIADRELVQRSIIEIAQELMTLNLHDIGHRNARYTGFIFRNGSFEIIEDEESSEESREESSEESITFSEVDSDMVIYSDDNENE
jgi:hypothetical protein